MIRNIQALRAFAAINVVLFHIVGTSRAYSQGVDLFSHFEIWGANGVDIFFVISGFVMVRTQFRTRRSPLKFLRNRILRIVPIYWAFTVFMIILFFVMPSILGVIAITPNWAFSSLFFVAQIFAGRDPIAHVGWTLEWEMFFYIVFATSLFFKSWPLQAGFVFLSVISFSVLTRNWIALEFLLGMSAAYAYGRLKISSNQGLMVAILGGVFLAVSLMPAVVALNINRALMWGIPSFFIVLGLVCCVQTNSRLLIYLGDASYSIYLAQVLTIPAFYMLSREIFDNWNGDILAILCLISTVLFGCVVHSMVEKPVANRIKKGFVS